jgi:dTDP-4-dehydrorhamnose reductase
LRTSIIGNELDSNRGLLEWFLSQNGECQGYTEAVFSGVPTLILVQAIESALKAQPGLSGLFQVASEPISKYNLLKLIAQVFGRQIKIIPNAELVINRSLDGSKFREATGFIIPSWGEMIEKMYIDRMTNVQK